MEFSVPLNWRLLRRLRTALPFRARAYVAPQTAKILDVLASRSFTQPEFIFFQLAISLSVLSKKLVVSSGAHLPVTHPNSYIQFAAPPKAGKTNAHVFGEALRLLILAVTGIDNEVRAGTTVGIYNGTVRSARRGGLPLLAPDEGISSVNGLLEPLSVQQTNFKPEVFLSSAWSGANVARAKANYEQLATENARLSILAFGTLADISIFHQLCRKHYTDRGLLGRFQIGFAPMYSQRCALPESDSPEDESLLAVNKTDLTKLVADAYVNVYRQAELPAFVGFHFSDDAVESLEELRASEAAQQDDDDEEVDWSAQLKSRLLSHLDKEFRSTEITEKWALLLHLLDVVLNSINFVERTISPFPVPTTISLATVERARLLVARLQAQDAFFLQVQHITCSTRNRDVIYVAENVDFVLYSCLRRLLLIWPGPVVTSESFSDRSWKLSLQIPFEEVVSAGQALSAIGNCSIIEGTTRISCPGIFKQSRVPRQSFRFYKTHPDLISLELLDELGIELKDYTVRYNMDYFQVVDAHSLRGQRREKTFNDWIAEIPDALLPKTGASTSGEQELQLPDHLYTPQATVRKYSKYQHEDVSLRFGAALPKEPARKKARPSSTDPQHLYHLPGAPTFSNYSL